MTDDGAGTTPREQAWSEDSPGTGRVVLLTRNPISEAIELIASTTGRVVVLLGPDADGEGVAALEALALREGDAVVLCDHDAPDAPAALRLALASAASYVAMMASRSRSARLLAELSDEGRGRARQAARARRPGHRGKGPRRDRAVGGRRDRRHGVRAQRWPDARMSLPVEPPPDPVARRRPWAPAAVGVGVALLVVAGAAHGAALDGRGHAADAGCRARGLRSRAAGHVPGDVDYDQAPPAGGDHDPAWLECGVYDAPVRDENAVHSLEHGTVWVTHDPDAGRGVGRGAGRAAARRSRSCRRTTGCPDRSW